MEFKYQNIWKQYVATHKNDSTGPNFYSLLEHLSGDALSGFVKDILIGQVTDLCVMFPSQHDRFVSDEARFFNLFMSTPQNIISEKLTIVFDDLFIRALKGAFLPEEKEKIISGIEAVTAKNKVGLSSQLILELTEFKHDLDESLRVELLMLLSKLGDYSDFSFWDTMRSKIINKPHIGAAVVEAFKKRYSWKALEVLTDYNVDVLKSYNPSPEHKTYFETAIEMALYNCLKEPMPDVLDRFMELRKRMAAPWFAKLVDEILMRPPFHSIKKELDAHIPLDAESIYRKVVDGNILLTEDNLGRRIRSNIPVLHELISLIITNDFLNSLRIDILIRFRSLLQNWEESTQIYIYNNYGVTLSGDDNILQDANDPFEEVLLDERSNVVEGSYGRFSLVDIDSTMKEAVQQFLRDGTTNN